MELQRPPYRNIVGMVSARRELWILGTDTSCVKPESLTLTPELARRLDSFLQYYLINNPSEYRNCRVFAAHMQGRDVEYSDGYAQTIAERNKLCRALDMGQHGVYRYYDRLWRAGFPTHSVIGMGKRHPEVLQIDKEYCDVRSQW